MVFFQALNISYKVKFWFIFVGFHRFLGVLGYGIWNH